MTETLRIMSQEFSKCKGRSLYHLWRHQASSSPQHDESEDEAWCHESDGSDKSIQKNNLFDSSSIRLIFIRIFFSYYILWVFSIMLLAYTCNQTINCKFFLCSAHFLFSIVPHFLFEPRQEVLDFSVNTKLSRSSAAISPTGRTLQVKSAATLAYHRSTAIPLTGINASFIHPCADHWIMDFIWICLLAASGANNWNRDLLKVIRCGTPRGQSTPACDPTVFPFNGRFDSFWKTCGIHVTAKKVENLSLTFK